MKPHILPTILALLCFGCQKYSYKETELHGMWQVISVEDKTTGELVETDGERYYIFQRHMAQVGYLAPNTGSSGSMRKYACEFSIENDSIYMGKFHTAPSTFLLQFGIYDEYTTFAIDKEKRNKLIFTSDKASISMRKY